MATAERQDERLAELERALDFLRDDVEVANALLGLSAALAEVKTVEQMLERTVRIVPELLTADRCFAATRDPVTRSLTIEEHWGFDEAGIRQIEQLAAADDLPVLRAALDERSPLLVPDTVADARVGPETSARRRLGAYIAIPLTVSGDELIGLGVEYSGHRTFTPRDHTLVRGIARLASVALANARRFSLLQSLRTFGLRIGSRLRLDAVNEAIATGARDLLSADDALTYLLDSSERVLVATGNPASSPVGTHLSRIDVDRLPWSSLLDGETVFVSDLHRALGIDEGPVSAVAAPIPGQPPILGAVVAFFYRPSLLGPEENEAINVLTAQSAMAITNAQRFERERYVARSLQAGLLTTDMPDLKGCEMSAVYEPAGDEVEIGGDFFDAFSLPNRGVGVVVGDVSGKGAAAAAQTAMVKYMLRAFAMRNPAPSSVLFHLNNALVRGFTEDRFATLVYAAFSEDLRSCTLAVAGHPDPLVCRGGSVVEAVGRQGSILGVFPDENFDQESIEFSDGDVFVAYTDGLSEARSGDEFYGRDRIEERLLRHAKLGADDLARRLYQDVKEFGEITDDAIVFAATFSAEE